jgi:hypothetical protein
LQNLLQTVIQQQGITNVVGVVDNNNDQVEEEAGPENENGENNNQQEVQIVFGFEAPNGDLNNATQAPQVTRALTLEEINCHTELFLFWYRNEEEQEEGVEGIEEEVCSICRQVFEDQEICRRITGCQHFFHHACVDSWIVRNPTCPMCRNTIVANEEEN